VVQSTACRACGHVNREDAAFCGRCGARFSTHVVCPACGRANAEDQRFCDGCGQRLDAAAEAPDQAPSLPARPVAFAGGRYRVERVHGEGGHKRVYLAHDTVLDRPVAVALVTASLDADLAERARREAQTMGRIAAHPNLVTVYDAGEEAGHPYIVEEYVDGTTLAAVIKEAAGAPLELRRVLGIALDVTAALDQVHRCGIVHRDLKPENVWLTADGTAKLGDFGLLAAVREFSSRTMAKLTDHGVMVGTIPYMPPEQALGERVDERADLFVSPPFGEVPEDGQVGLGEQRLLQESRGCLARLALGCHRGNHLERDLGVQHCLPAEHRTDRFLEFVRLDILDQVPFRPRDQAPQNEAVL